MAEEEKEEKTSKKKGGGSLVLIIVVFLFVLLLAVVGVIGWLMVQSPEDTSSQGASVSAQTQQTNRGKNAGNASATRGSDYANIGPMYPLESFTLNLLSDGGARYVKCTMQLEQNTDLLQAELDKKMPIIRDVIIRTLTSKTFEEVSTTKGKERLKDELVGKINEVLTDGFVKNIYFTDFVVQ